MEIQLLPTEPHLVAPDTYLIPAIAAEPSGGYVSANSLVIRGEEPVIVDTSCSLLPDEWVAKVFSVVEPEDVRWVFISHDDHDHIGNLELVLDEVATLAGEPVPATPDQTMLDALLAMALGTAADVAA